MSTVSTQVAFTSSIMENTHINFITSVSFPKLSFCPIL